MVLDVILDFFFKTDCHSVHNEALLVRACLVTSAQWIVFYGHIKILFIANNYCQSPTLPVIADAGTGPPRQ